MVIAQGKLTVLPVKTVSAKIVFSGWAGAVSPPISKGFDDLIQSGVVGVNRAAFAHGHMVRRIKAGGTDIANGSGEFFFTV